MKVSSLLIADSPEGAVIAEFNTVPIPVLGTRQI